MSSDSDQTVIFDDGTARFAVDRVDSEVIVRAGGELDVSSRDAHNVVLECVAQCGTTDTEQTVVVDMRNVQFCDSTGIILLLRLQQQAEERGDKFAVREPSAAVRRVLVAGGLHDLVEGE